MKLANVLLAVMLTLAPCTTGCALFSGSATTAEKASDVQRLAYAAASIGTQAALLQNPAYRPAFLLAYQNLDMLIVNKVVTGAALRQVLATLPVKELKSPQAQLAVDAALTLFDMVAGTKLEVEKSPYVLAAATGVKDGLKAALGL